MCPDILNEMPWGDLDERIDFPKCSVFQVNHPKYFIFWDRRISVILSVRGNVRRIFLLRASDTHGIEKISAHRGNATSPPPGPVSEAPVER